VRRRVYEPFSDACDRAWAAVGVVVEMLGDPFEEFLASLFARKDGVPTDFDPGAGELFVLLGGPIGGALSLGNADADEAGEAIEAGVGGVDAGVGDLDGLGQR
jgi:hypothetical protein